MIFTSNDERATLWIQLAAFCARTYGYQELGEEMAIQNGMEIESSHAQMYNNCRENNAQANLISHLSEVQKVSAVNVKVPS